MRYILGSDIGTSGTKTILFDEEGREIASSLVEYPLYQPAAGWAEQDPDDWWNAVADGIADVVKKSDISPREIVGLGLSGQMHGLVMLDRAGKPIRRSIIWCDQRTQAECDEITALVGRERLIEITANPALTGFTASKILWVRKHEPELFAECAHILLPKDYVRYRLTGKFATDVSDASGMQLLDVVNRRWSSEMFEGLGLDPALFAEVFESSDVTGRITAEAAVRTGLAEGTPVAGGAGDQAAAAVGNGIVFPGAASCNIGSSGVVFAHTDSPKIDPKGRVHTFCHAVRNCWHVMGVTQGAGLSMKWFKDNFYSEEAKTVSKIYRYIDEQIESVPAGSAGVVYLPYLMGERTPHLDANARGVFFGLSAIHEKRHLSRAVMEGVSYSLLDCLSVLRELDASGNEVRICGGGAKSPIWRQMIADMFRAEVKTTNVADAGSLGAAILGGVAAGVWPDVQTACSKLIQTNDSVLPDLERAGIYERGHAIYRRLYPALKGSFDALAEENEAEI